MRVAFRLLGLPHLAPVRVDDETEERFDALADRLLAGDATALPDPALRLDFLRWLAERRDVLFHGSARADLSVLDPVRLTSDATEFGNQQAVYATSDPVWAIYFATLRRTGRFSTRNGSMGLAGASVYPRWYFFSVNGIPENGRFGDGSLYILPSAGFRLQPPLFGVLDSAQWVCDTRVRALARLDVTAGDFPFRDGVVEHSEREPLLVTWLRAGARARRQRSSRR